MGLMRLLFLAVLVWLVWRILRQTLLSPTRKIPPASPPNSNQKMVRCEWCEVHTPEALALRQNKHHFCSEEHRQRWLEKHHD